MIIFIINKSTGGTIMFGFIKKLFGGDTQTNTEVGVQVEQAPYKVPEPAATTPIPLVVETVKPASGAKPAPKKNPAPKKQGVAPKQGNKPRGRKPKAKTQ
jgi:hypothetical protein